MLKGNPADGASFPYSWRKPLYSSLTEILPEVRLFSPKSKYQKKKQTKTKTKCSWHKRKPNIFICFAIPFHSTHGHKPEIYSLKTRCVCETQMSPIMANSIDGQDHKNKYFDTSKKILSQEMAMCNMETLISNFLEIITNVNFFFRNGQMSKSKG